MGPNEWLAVTTPFLHAEISFSAGQADVALAGYLARTTRDPVFIALRSTWCGGQAISCVRVSHRPGHRMTARYRTGRGLKSQDPRQVQPVLVAQVKVVADLVIPPNLGGFISRIFSARCLRRI